MGWEWKELGQPQETVDTPDNGAHGLTALMGQGDRKNPEDKVRYKETAKARKKRVSRVRIPLDYLDQKWIKLEAFE